MARTPKNVEQDNAVQAARIHREIVNDGSHRDHIHNIDMRQNEADARVCGKDPSHGRLTVVASGTDLVCAHFMRRIVHQGVAKSELCDYAEPVSR